MTITVALANDSDLMMVGIQAILEAASDYRVVGKVQTLTQIVQCLEQESPAIIILSDYLYDTDVLSAIDTVRLCSPKTHIIMIGMMTDGILIHNMFAQGVNGYLYRGDPLSECLLPAIQTVLQGRPYLSPTPNAEYLHAVHSGQRLLPLDAEARTVLNYLAQGISVNQIAFQMGVSPRKVYSIRERLRHRFGVETNEHLISRAVAEGFTVLSAL